MALSYTLSIHLFSFATAARGAPIGIVAAAVIGARAPVGAAGAVESGPATIGATAASGALCHWYWGSGSYWCLSTCWCSGAVASGPATIGATSASGAPIGIGAAAVIGAFVHELTC